MEETEKEDNKSSFDFCWKGFLEQEAKEIREINESLYSEHMSALEENRNDFEKFVEYCVERELLWWGGH
ncbi:hypothetical protein GOV10_03145 [Candidatus Woesearchaeota archaeon]|nr:hypothetical protein [Candidatus Woesearchaeota archaeon]